MSKERYTINDQRVKAVTSKYNSKFDCDISEGEIRSMLTVVYNYHHSHQEWLDTAPIDELVKKIECDFE